MKIIYYIPHDKYSDDGITKKIYNQVYEWQKNGADVKCLWHYKNASTDLSKGEINYSRFAIPKNTLKLIKDFKPDLIYFRYSSLNFLLLYLLVFYRSIFEINGIAHTEKKPKSFTSYIQHIKNFIHYLSFKIIKQLSPFAISPTEELKLKLSLNKCEIIPNSINTDKYTAIKKQYLDRQLELFFMGTNDYSWFGIHYIEELARLIPEYKFNVIGSSGSNTRNLFFHGYLTRVKYLEILKKCSICIGTLALHERGLQESRPLKVREYIAYGYPIIVNYKDQNNVMDKDWCLFLNINKIEDLESKVEEIKEFCNKYKNYTLSKDDISIVSSSKIESDRFKVMKQYSQKGLF